MSLLFILLRVLIFSHWFESKILARRFDSRSIKMMVLVRATKIINLRNALVRFSFASWLN